MSAQMGLGNAIALISIGTLLITAVFVFIALLVVPGDIEALRVQMRERARHFESKAATVPTRSAAADEV
jgi:hypothetical protein